MRKSKATRPAKANITIKDIAKHLGIAHSTVSRALRDHPYTNRETKERVRGAAEEIGYVPHSAARTLRSNKGVLVGLILPSIASEAYATAAQILSHRCLGESLQMVLAISEDDPDIEYGHVEALRSARAAGIIIAPCHGLQDRTATLLKSIPTVLYVRQQERVRAPFVSVDSGHGIELATEHLLRLGHQRIAYLGPSKEASPGADRLAGFVNAHAKFKLKPDMAIARDGVMDAGSARFELAELLHSDRRPTAVLVAADPPMTGVLQAIRDARLQVPDDISIIGYGNPRWYEVWGPGITTIAQPFTEMANRAASELMTQIASSSERRIVQVKLGPELILRGSTGRPPPSALQRASRPNSSDV